MKKNTFIFFALMLLTSTVFSQPFEGEIVYENTFKSKTLKVPNEQFASMLGTTQNYYIRGGDYKSETNGKFLLWQLYVHKDNKLYVNLSNSKAILWNDGAVNPDEVISSELHKNAEVILGYTCDELILTCKSGIQKYYFSSKIPADSKLFMNHKFGNWYAYLSKANALPLKTIIDSEQFTIESVATKVIPMNLEQAFFSLPANIETTKNPY